MDAATGTKFRLTLGLLAVSFLALFSNGVAQNKSVNLPDGKRISINKNSLPSYSYTMKNGKAESVPSEDPHELVRVIVVLKDKPLALYRTKKAPDKISMTSVHSSLQAVHSSVKSKIAAIAQQLSSRGNFQYHYNVIRDYYEALNGIAVECNRGLLKYIRTMPEVQSVSYDQQIKIDLKQSVHQIGADIVQDSLGYKGDSVLVGEVDTGIDYNNPALGGGFGPGHRVIGGYDFINNDNDPMDDHGHGTHVAGIIGADGGPDLTGVAPHVKFLAVKVLDAQGYGTEIGVIAGLDYCMDPDGNPETDDAVDIINMSIGGGPDPVMDSVVDNITAAGILSVVAAGNSGYYKTIGSPGTAQTALTVGACDSTDQMASFSSKGPDPLGLGIKPEIVAPGVDILSTLPNNQTASWSGTSMATPHVTGVAALLKQMHRNWTPEQLKDAIVNSAKPLSGVSPYDCGNGRVSAINAAENGLTVDNPVLSFGVCNLSFSVWKDTLQFKVKNLRNVSQSVALSVQFDVSTPSQVNLSPSSFTLLPTQEQTVTAILSVPQSVALLQSGSHAYSGKIVCVSDSDRVQVPFGFIKSNMMIVNADCQPLQLMIWGDNYLDVATTAEGVYGYEFLPPQATVNLYALLCDSVDQGNGVIKPNYYHIIRTNINTTGFNYINLGHAEAPLCAFKTDNLLDVNNGVIKGIDSASYAFYLIGQAVNVAIELGGSSEGYSGRLDSGNVYLSPIDTSMLMFRSLSAVGNNGVVQLQKFTKGAANQNDLDFPSGPGNLSDFDIKFDYQPSETCYPQIDYTYYDYSGDVAGMSYWVTSPVSTNLRNLKSVHYSLSKDPSEDFPIRYGSANLVIVKEADSHDAGSTLYSPQLHANDNGGVTFFERKEDRVDPNEEYNDAVLGNGDTVCFGGDLASEVNLPVFWLESYSWATAPASLVLVDHYRTTHGGGVCRSDGGREFSIYGPDNGPPNPPRFKHRLYSKNCVVASMPGSEQDDSLAEFAQYSSADFGRCRLIAETLQYDLLGQSGQSVIDYDFSLCGGVTPNPYYLIFPFSYFTHTLDLFQVLGDGKPVKWLQRGVDGQLRLVLFDPKVNVDSVSFAIVNDDGSERELVTTHPAVKEYYASIPQDLSEGFVDVIARAHNTEGNKFELCVSPAFYYGKDTTNLQFTGRLYMNNYVLQKANPYQFNVAGDTLRYDLTYHNYGSATARNVVINLPETNLATPISSNAISIDSILANDSCKITLLLKFLGKTKNDQYAYYSPTISWSSGSKTFTRSDKILMDLSLSRVTSVDGKENVPLVYALYDNYPNPFNPTTVIEYQLAAVGDVTLKVYDVLGREVKILVNERQNAGTHTVKFDGSSLSSGVYFYRLHSGSYTATKKLLLLK